MMPSFSRKDAIMSLLSSALILVSGMAVLPVFDIVVIMEHFNEQTEKDRKTPLPPSVIKFVQDRGLEGKVEAIPLYGGSRVEVRMDGTPQVLITEHLNGCTATVIVTEHEDLTRSAQLVHFPPFFLDSHMKKIDSLASEEDRAAQKNESLIYMSETRQENRATIEEHLRSIFGDSIAITFATYQENAPHDHAGTLAVEIPGNPDEPTRYHTS
jgi:hypothetical protein